MTLDLAEEYQWAHFFDVCRARSAREHFARVGPPELQPLPLSHSEISDRKYNWAVGASAEFRALAFISSRFADSLRADDDWDYWNHPSFDDYVRGVLASKHPDLDHRQWHGVGAALIFAADLQRWLDYLAADQGNADDSRCRSGGGADLSRHRRRTRSVP